MILTGTQDMNVLMAAGATFARPNKDGTMFVLPDTFDATKIPVAELIVAKREKVASLRKSCRSAIYAGMNSLALGTAHHYPLSDTDQANNQRAGLLAEINKLDATWLCRVQALAVGDVVPTYRNHTAAQMLVVAKDIDNHVHAQIGKLQTLVAQVKVATTKIEVDAVVWL